MGSVKSVNGASKLTPKAQRLTGVLAGINPTDAVNKAQLDALQEGTVDVTRIELASAGTAAAPAITWDGDTDTGIYQVAANEIGLTTGGTQRVTVTSAGLQVVAAVNVGTNITMTKEVNHTVSVTTSTTADTAGGNLTLSSAIGFGAASGGTTTITAGTSGAGATGDGGRVAITAGAAASTNGAGGAVLVTAGAKAGTGVGGQVILRSATDTPVLIKRAVAGTGADTVTLTVAQLFNGIFNQTSTAATTCTTPTGTEISAALGSTLAVGDSFDFCLINSGGTGDNITFTAGAAGVTITGHAVVYPAADVGTAGAASGTFRFVNSAANTWIAYRIA